jgi:hypothetical protein
VGVCDCENFDAVWFFNVNHEVWEPIQHRFARITERKGIGLRFLGDPCGGRRELCQKRRAQTGKSSVIPILSLGQIDSGFRLDKSGFHLRRALISAITS